MCKLSQYDSPGMTLRPVLPTLFPTRPPPPPDPGLLFAQLFKHFKCLSDLSSAERMVILYGRNLW